MKAPELYSISLELGKEILEPQGFTFKNGSWYYSNDKYLLAFELANILHSQDFNVKYVTLVFYNYIKPRNRAELKTLQPADKNGPVQINPALLPNYDNWNYINPYTKGDNSFVYCPLYYGGIVQKGFLSKFSRNKSVELKNGCPPKWIIDRGADIISEDVATKLLATLMKNTAKFAFSWADKLTPEEILRQLETYGEDWFVEREWIEAFKLHCANKI